MSDEAGFDPEAFGLRTGSLPCELRLVARTPGPYSTRQAGHGRQMAFRLPVADLWILGLYIRSSCHVRRRSRVRDLPRPSAYEEVA
jgi:hypothetical protein